MAIYLLRSQRCFHRPLYLLETEIAPYTSKLQAFRVTVTSRWGGKFPHGRTLKPVHWCIQKQEAQGFSTELFLEDKPCFPSRRVKERMWIQFMTRNGTAKELDGSVQHQVQGPKRSQSNRANSNKHTWMLVEWF